MDSRDGMSGFGTFRIQPCEATIRSNDSGYAVISNDRVNNMPREEGKIKAYVDFKDFQRNYIEYLKRGGGVLKAHGE